MTRFKHIAGIGPVPFTAKEEAEQDIKDQKLSKYESTNQKIERIRSSLLNLPEDILEKYEDDIIKIIIAYQQGAITYMKLKLQKFQASESSINGS